MGIISPSLPTIGGSDATEEPKVRNALAEIIGLLNGGIDAENLETGGVGTDELASNAVTLVKIAQAARGVKMIGLANHVASTINAPFTMPYTGPALIVAQTTAIVNVGGGGGLAGVQIHLDNVNVEYSERYFDGAQNATRQLWPLHVYYAASLAAGGHNLKFANGGAALMDGSDRMSFVVLEARA